MVNKGGPVYVPVSPAQGGKRILEGFFGFYNLKIICRFTYMYEFILKVCSDVKLIWAKICFPVRILTGFVDYVGMYIHV